MTGASHVLDQAQARGIDVRAAGKYLEISPKSRLTADLIRELKIHKADVLALVKIRQALSGYGAMTALQLEAATGLSYRDLYRAVGELYDLYELSLNAEGEFWLVEQVVN